MRSTILFRALLLATLCSSSAIATAQTDVWEQQANFSGGARIGAVSFEIASLAYVSCGQDGNTFFNDLWRYDALTDSWSQMANLPGAGRAWAMSFALDGKGYIGTGRIASGPLPNNAHLTDDFFAYDPLTNTWASAPAYPGGFGVGPRFGGIAFVIGGVAYAGMGETGPDGGIQANMNRFDPVIGWQFAAGPGYVKRRMHANAFSANGNGYVVMGVTGIPGNGVPTELLEFDPINASWTNKASCPGPGRYAAANFSVGSSHIIATGVAEDGSLLNDGWEYNSALDTWFQRADPGPAGRYGAAGFAVGGHGYLTCGAFGFGTGSSDTRRYTPVNDCLGVPGGAALPTTSCDDGNANTVNDVFTSGCVCAGTPLGNDAWTQQADFSGFPRLNAVAFTIGDYGYLGTGQSAFGYEKDLWRYDRSSDSWSQMADVDVSGRMGAFAFAIGDYGYVGGGLDDLAPYNSDLRRYDPVANEWTVMWVNHPCGYGRVHAAAFAANGRAYMGTGQTPNGYTQDFWEYDPTSNGWSQLTDYPGGERWATCAFVVGSKGYVGTGFTNTGSATNDFFAFDALTLSWSPISDFGGTERGRAVSFSLSGKGYVGTGADATEFAQDFWQYEPTTDTWASSASLIGTGRWGATAFVVNGNGYVATGYGTDGLLGDVWEYTPDGVTCTVGDPCDDGLAYTQNDTLTTNCACAGVCISDLDLDGLCDEADPCPYQSLAVGSACDDFNPCTENDVVQPWCGCYGTPLPDGDADGICDLLDQCPSSPGSIGYSCDDGNPCTSPDVVDANCVCVGQIPDANNDGLSDLCNPYVLQTASSGCSTYMLLSRSNWTNAEAAAVALGGHLVTINDAAEDAFIYSTFTQSGPVQRGLWIGFNDEATEDEFVWSSGEASTYTNWTPGEPSNLSGERYAGIFWPSEPRAPQWFDETNGFLPYGFDIGVYMYGVVEIPAVDSDNDGLCDAIDNCPNLFGQIGSACDDGNASTNDDVLGPNCVCTGTPACTPPTGLVMYGSAVEGFCIQPILLHVELEDGTGPFTYSWTGDGSFTNIDQDSTVVIPVEGMNRWTVIVTNACGSATTTYQDAWFELIYSATVTDVSCVGGSDGAIDLFMNGFNVQQPASYLWLSPSICNTPSECLATFPGCTAGHCSTNTEDVTGLTTGTYTVTATRGACTTTRTYTIGTSNLDSDSDGVLDCVDNCPNIPGQIGSTCDDGNACTLNDVLDANCQCIGTPLLCDDGNVCNGVETCVAGVCVPGVALNCDDGNPCTVDSCDPLTGCTHAPVPDGTMCAINAQCQTGICTPIVMCTHDLRLIFQTDGVSNIGWQVRDQLSNAVLASGGGAYPPSSDYTVSICLPNGCYYLVVTDGEGNGISGGGYILQMLDGRRIVDDRDNFLSGSTSQISGNQGFCLPLGNDRLISASCDRLDLKRGATNACSDKLTADNTPNGTSGSVYQYWFFDPNGTLSIRFPASGTTNNQVSLFEPGLASLVEGKLYNVRVRTRVGPGVWREWGPGCRMRIDNPVGQCPQTKLQDEPGNAHLSCGSTKPLGNSSVSLVYAKPRTRLNANCVAIPANKYQFRFRLASEGVTIVKNGVGDDPWTYLNMNNLVARTPASAVLQACRTYQVEVRTSWDGGATWCAGGAPLDLGMAWGEVCPLYSAGCSGGPICGNGITESGEQCDDGNLVNGDGCDANCTLTGSGMVGTAWTREPRMQLYPNPNHGEQLFLRLTDLAPTVSTVAVDVYDLFGKRVLARTIPTQDGFLNTRLEPDGPLATGLYVVNITAGAESFTERLVIQH